MRGRGRQNGGRFGTFLVLAGIAGVLGVTFVAGLWTGHHWPVLTGIPKPPSTAEAPASKRGGDERPHPAGNLPALTFYQELKAPLTAPPPPPKPAKSLRPPDLAVPTPAAPAAAGLPATAARPEPAPRTGATRDTQATRDTTVAKLEPAQPETGARFTVQVAAYNARSPAETLRATLAAAGHDARIVVAGAQAGVRYRVQVGAFTSREAAQQAAARLAAERALQPFVTTR